MVEGQGTNSLDYYEEESVIDTGLAAREDPNKENHSPYFITPPGPLKQLEVRVNSSLNDLISPQVSMSLQRSQRLPSLQAVVTRLPAVRETTSTHDSGPVTDHSRTGTFLPKNTVWKRTRLSNVS